MKKRPEEHNNPAMAAALIAGDRRALAKAITLIESRRSDQRQAAAELLAALMPKTGKALRVGISGSPGVGKSTFIEALGKLLIAKGHRLAILAIDPSSPLSGGSIMGDRTRMEELSRHPQAFIRPSPSGGSLGGVARHTRETILACEAAGYDIIIVETVGVGQSEYLAASMVDCFLILQLPNAGDELQGLKKGILELADVIAVTKADNAQKAAAAQAKGQLERALMFTRGASGRQPPVHLCSALEETGLDSTWQSVSDLFKELEGSGALALKRQKQVLQWYQDEVGEQLHEAVMTRPSLKKKLNSFENLVLQGTLPASVAAARFVDEVLIKV